MTQFDYTLLPTALQEPMKEYCQRGMLPDPVLRSTVAGNFYAMIKGMDSHAPYDMDDLTTLGLWLEGVDPERRVHGSYEALTYWSSVGWGETQSALLGDEVVTHAA